MFFFFLFNSEERIGFKKLTNADKGLSKNSKQSHIGLYEGVLDFLDNRDVVKSAMLIYGTYCDILDCSFDRIKASEGSYRSPKIRVGSNVNNSVVSKIRQFVATAPGDDWYLAWTGLDSKEIVFWLIKSNTADYQTAHKFFPKDRFILDQSSPNYDAAKNFILNKINFVSYQVQKDIELKSQIGDIKHIYKSKDLEKAKDVFKQIGRDGEELVNIYLEKEKRSKRISSFEWVNRSAETGLPYDFIINDSLYVDVKSTRFEFDQYLFYSNQEIDFATTKNNLSYSVFRVYDMKEKVKKMTKCNDCINYMQSIKQPIDSLKKTLVSQNSLLQELKLGVRPADCFTNILTPIIL